MADVNRGNRPLSPHMTAYNMLRITSGLSILHRITGCALTVGALLGVWWFLAAATGPEAFATADAVATSFIGDLVWLGSLWALSYHFCNGIRHLSWDTGHGFELETARRTGIAALAGSVVLTALVLVLI